ncbi:MAG: hypothetical protein NE330_08305, partial [Lentisphaeraceae bacterium]|nr:hypothetical protein [Lentisphaeraceae bacterium]
TASATTTETMMLMDTYKAWRTTYPGYMESGKLFEEGAPNANVRHSGKANVSYLDGSGKLQSSAYLLERSSGAHTFWDVTQ